MFRYGVRIIIQCCQVFFSDYLDHYPDILWSSAHSGNHDFKTFSIKTEQSKDYFFNIRK